MELESSDITPIVMLEKTLEDLKSGALQFNKAVLVLLDDSSGKLTHSRLMRAGPSVFTSLAMLEVAKHDLLEDTRMGIAEVKP